MSQVVVTVVLQAKPGMGDELLELMLGSVRTTHEDEGCSAYALHVANDDPDRYVVERSVNQAALDAHLGQPFVAELFAAWRACSWQRRFPCSAPRSSREPRPKAPWPPRPRTGE